MDFQGNSGGFLGICGWFLVEFCVFYGGILVDLGVSGGFLLEFNGFLMEF